MGERRVRRIRDAWLHMVGNLIAVSLAGVNFYLRSTGDALDAISPAGVVLSGSVVGLLLFNGWMGWKLVYHHHVGVADEASPEVQSMAMERVRARSDVRPSRTAG
jgi:uncharacterized membrane protein